MAKLIPQGSILVATLEPNSDQTNPQLKGFSSADLFQGKDAFTANELFTKVQRDLEVSSVTGIYNRKYDWQKEILKEDLNAEQQTLITQVFEENDASTKEGQDAIADFFGLRYTETQDDLQNYLQKEIISSFVDFVEKKQLSLNDSNEIDRSKVKASKQLFLANRDIYQDFTKSKITRKQVASRYKKANGKSLPSSIVIAEDTDSTDSITVMEAASSNPSNTISIVTKPSAPAKPQCMINKKPKNRGAQCKRKAQKYRKALAQYNKQYG